MNDEPFQGSAGSGSATFLDGSRQFSARKTALPLDKNGCFGEYEILRLLGSGGMGDVYLAKHDRMKRSVALKVLHPSLTGNKAYLERFFREVRTLARIQHPNIVQAYEVGVDGEICFFTMEYAPGRDLASKIEEVGVLPEVDALKIACAVAKTLKYAWNKYKLIHRDVKPANIVVTPDGEIKLMDLGISRHGDSDESLTVTGMVVGSPHYISPEQARGKKDLDFRSDIYSLGATLFHMLAGDPPYSAEDGMGVIACHLSDPVPDIRKIAPRTSPRTALIIARMMAKERKERYADWDLLIEAFESSLIELGERVVRTTPDPGNALFRFLSWGLVGSASEVQRWRLIRLVFLLAVCICAFLIVVRRSVRISREKEIAGWYEEAVRRFEHDEGSDSDREALALLARAAQSGHSVYAARSREKAKALVERIRTRNARSARRSDVRDGEAWKRLKRTANDFESRGDFDGAIRHWRLYRESGSERDLFSSEISQEIDYLVRQKEKQEKGLLP